MIGAIAWDIDGTLIDSEPTHQAALTAVCARYGVNLPNLENVFTGIALEDVWTALRRRLPESLERDAWLEEIVDAYVEMAPALRPFAGARKTVEDFARSGRPQACVSNSGRRIVDANLAALGFADLFQFSISRNDVANGKPHPEPYSQACERFGLAPAAVLAVEDSAVGAAAAVAAGLAVVRIDERRWDYAAVVEAVGA